MRRGFSDPPPTDLSPPHGQSDDEVFENALDETDTHVLVEPATPNQHSLFSRMRHSIDSLGASLLWGRSQSEDAADKPTSDSVFAELESRRTSASQLSTVFSAVSPSDDTEDDEFYDINDDEDGHVSVPDRKRTTTPPSSPSSPPSPIPSRRLTSIDDRQDKRQTFYEFLQTSPEPAVAIGDFLVESERVDSTITLESFLKDLEDCDSRHSPRPESNLRHSPESTDRDESSLSTLRSPSGSVEGKRDASPPLQDQNAFPSQSEDMRRSLLFPAPNDTLRRANPLSSFFATAQLADGTHHDTHDDSHDADSMISGFSGTMTLRTEASIDASRLSRVPSGASESLFDRPDAMRTARRFKPVAVRTKAKTRQEFGHLHLIQELNKPSPATLASVPQTPSPSAKTDASRAVLAIKFSPDGNFLAAAGADSVIRIWRLLAQSVLDRTADADGTDHAEVSLLTPPVRVATIFEGDPVQTLAGHNGEVLDLAWSGNNFLLSASMDKTVRLWHYSRPDALGIFQHLDYVTSVAFHPRDPRLFVSGSLDCKLRLWSIQERVIQCWNELPPGNFITAVAFTRSGRVVVAGTSGGVALLFDTEGLRYHTQIQVRSSHKRSGKKITGIDSVPGQYGDERVPANCLITHSGTRVDYRQLQRLAHQNVQSARQKCPVQVQGP